MKNNLQYIFDKILRSSTLPPLAALPDAAALMELAVQIGAADRGVAIGEEKAGLIAAAVLSSRNASDDAIRQLRADLLLHGQGVAPSAGGHAAAAGTIRSGSTRLQGLKGRQSLLPAGPRWKTA